MNFFTQIEHTDDLPRLAQTNSLMSLGSCFASEMGQRLTDAKFRCDINPYGVLYNPDSIATALREIAAGKIYEREDLFFFRELWHSPMHHGDFSSASAEDALEGINLRLKKAHEEMSQLDYLLLTFGTAWIYENKDTRRIVGNCHKLPEKNFTRRKLSVEEVVTDYTSLLSELLSQNPRLKILFTVSPIRHIRDGMHANNLSKATLLLAIEQLQEAFPTNVFYFPAYELLIDELRDYRFYAEDMVHPSAVAVRYVWERFVQTCISTDALQIMEESEKISKALSHRPFHPEADEYKHFLGQIVLKIERLNEKYPYLDFKKEREICRIQLKA